MEKFKTFLKDHWLDIVLVIIIIVLVIFGARSCTNYKNEKKISDNNIIALTDSINYYKGENDKLVAEKTLLIGDKETLELAYQDLSKELKQMKVKNAAMAVKIASLINNPQRDTIWKVDNDTSIFETYNFDDMPYRKLSGTVALENKELTMSVDTDQVYLDLTVAVEDNKVKVSSNNPYVTFEDMYGITVPEYEPTWCLVVGPCLGVGAGATWNPSDKVSCVGLSGFVGVSLTFGWNIVGVGKRVKK